MSPLDYDFPARPPLPVRVRPSRDGLGGKGCRRSDEPAEPRTRTPISLAHWSVPRLRRTRTGTRSAKP